MPKDSPTVRCLENPPLISPRKITFLWLRSNLAFILAGAHFMGYIADNILGRNSELLGELPVLLKEK